MLTNTGLWNIMSYEVVAAAVIQSMIFICTLDYLARASVRTSGAKFISMQTDNGKCAAENIVCILIVNLYASARVSRFEHVHNYSEQWRKKRNEQQQPQQKNRTKILPI